MALITTRYPDGYQPTVFIDPLPADIFVAGTITSKSATSFTIDAHGNGIVVTISGTGFRYGSDGLPTQGVVNQAAGFQNGTPIYTVSGLQTSVPELANWFSTGNGDNPLFTGNDTLTGGSGSDYFSGHSGHDILSGGAGVDQLSGGNGNDHIYGQSSNGGPDDGDVLFGDAGNDYLQGNAGDDRLDGGAGSDRINGGAGNDLIFGGSSVLNGPKAGSDTVNGNLGDDTIIGAEGNDSLRGGQGNDQVQGGDGDDLLMGDKGDDILSGGRGYDLFIGGEGRDLFRFDDLNNSAPIAAEFTTTGPNAYRTDIVADFHNGEDRLAFATPGAIVRDIAVDVQAATTLAQTLLDRNPGDSEVAAIRVGNDTYLFFHLGSGTVQATSTVNAAILLLDVAPSMITADDFGF